MQNVEQERLAYSINEAGTVIGLGRTKMHEVINAGLIRTVRVGRRILVPRKAIEEYLEGAAK